MVFSKSMVRVSDAVAMLGHQRAKSNALGQGPDRNSRFFVDTFYLIALSNRWDQWHRRVVTFSRALRDVHFMKT
jgi:hypothetical protein